MQWLSFITIIVAASTLTNSRKGLDIYPVKKTDSKLSITGKGDHPQWQKASALTDFRYPWEDEAAPPTMFKALHDEALAA